MKRRKTAKASADSESSNRSASPKLLSEQSRMKQTKRVVWYSSIVVVAVLLTAIGFFCSVNTVIRALSTLFHSDDTYKHETTFTLYTRDHNEPQKLKTGNFESLDESRFNKSNPTWIYTHGWLGRGNDKYSLSLKNAILKKYDVNVVLVDWSQIANDSVVLSRWGIPHVAANVSSFVDFLSTATSESNSTSNINLVGFSFGAHVAGVAARFVQGGFQGNLVGIDAPSTLFDWFDYDNRISKYYAPYVEVIHSAGGMTSYMLPIGHVDMYINGGLYQNGCPMGVLFLCSHMIALEAYIKSFEEDIVGRHYSNLFAAWIHGDDAGEGDGNATMGGWMPKSLQKGVYYVNYPIREEDVTKIVNWQF